MTNTGTTHLHFIPIGRPIIDALDLATAITMAIFGKRSADARMYLDDDGAVVLGLHNPRTGGRDFLRVGDDHVPAQEYGIMLIHGGAVIGRALLEGEISAFVIDKAGSYLRVPRYYWLNVYPGSATVIEQTDTDAIPDDLVGRPLLVDPADLGKWTNATRPAVEEMVAKTRAARGEIVPQPSSHKPNRGPDPWKEYPKLKMAFAMHDEKMSNMRSARARHKYLKKIWLSIEAKMGRPTCPDYKVVERCWGRYKDELAARQ